jgi:hypothetical protein
MDFPLVVAQSGVGVGHGGEFLIVFVVQKTGSINTVPYALASSLHV